MAERRGPSTPKDDLLSLDKADDLVILQLVRKARAHLSREQGIMLQTVQQVITGMTLGDELCDLGCNLTQFDSFGSVMRTTEEDEAGGAGSNRRVLGVFLSIE